VSSLRTQEWKAGWKSQDWKDVVKTFCLNGIDDDGKHFNLLAFSASGIRTAQAYFFQEDKDWTVASLRNELGDFSAALATGVPKYIARLGQTLSKSASTFTVSSDEMLEGYLDIKHDGYNFSDGCGMISADFAAKIVKVLSPLYAKQFAFEKGGYIPSVFQIRIGGYKGVVAVHKIEELVKSQHKLVLRPSMKKFSSNHRELEVLNFSHQAFNASINKQIIILLNSLGVPFSSFEILLEQYLDKILRIRQDSQVALELSCSNPNDSTVNDEQLNPKAYAMLLAGYHINEPYLQSLLKGIQRYKLKALESSMRIPLKNARYLIGVVDEYGVLEPNEVYISPSHNGTVLKEVVVTRNPCLHPGDVRKLQGVDVPQLAHLKDCIVFSRKGKRPVTDMMSGGDLDGDIYFACWEDSIVSQTKQFEPAKYAEPENGKQEVKKDPSIKRLSQNEMNMNAEMANFFLNYQEKNELGLLTVAHETRCAASELGACDPKAIELAVQANIAVDSAKTGNFSSKLSSVDVYLKRPHYSDQNGVKYEHSVIGKLYDKLKEYTADQRELNSNSNEMTPDPDLKYIIDEDVWKSHFQNSAPIMKKFNLRLNDIISDKTQDPKEKGFFNKKLFKSLEAGPKTKLIQEFRDIFHQDVKTEEEKKQKASAWYWYAYTEKKQAFPWVVAEYLNRIKADADATRHGIGLGISIAPSVFNQIKPRKAPTSYK